MWSVWFGNGLRCRSWCELDFLCVYQWCWLQGKLNLIRQVPLIRSEHLNRWELKGKTAHTSLQICNFQHVSLLLCLSHHGVKTLIQKKLVSSAFLSLFYSNTFSVFCKTEFPSFWSASNVTGITLSVIRSYFCSIRSESIFSYIFTSPKVCRCRVA